MRKKPKNNSAQVDPLEVVGVTTKATLPNNGRKVHVQVQGMDRDVSPETSCWDEFFLLGPKASEDFLMERSGQHQDERVAF